ncbi:MAG: prevent-host-death protein [Cupriavidus sp.]|nr:prevent-host-death protein [Cupriavidus sp.]
MRVLKVRAASVRLAQVLEAVCRGHQPTMIVRRRGAPVVLMSLAEFRSLQASLHLLGGEANAVRLRESIAEFRAGKTVIRAWGRSADRRRS